MSTPTNHAGKTIDPEWLRWVSQLIAKLKHLRWQYTDGAGRRGRSSMGIVNSTGCTSVWASTYPFNPYPFPWTNHLFQDSPSMAMGIFEGHMSRMAEGFAAIRMAELELDSGYRKEKHAEFFTYFNWKQFSEEEFHLCPPVVSIGGDGAMYDIGFQNLSRMMMSGKPIKVLVHGAPIILTKARTSSDVGGNPRKSYDKRRSSAAESMSRAGADRRAASRLASTKASIPPQHHFPSRTEGRAGSWSARNAQGSA